MLGNKTAAEQLTVEGPPFPEALDYLWSWFLKHSMGLASAGEGFPMVTWEGLAAWARHMQIDLEPWEAEAMVLLSTIRANIHAEQVAARMKAASK
jgi:hypothetical protein